MCWADKLAILVAFTFWLLVFAVTADKAGMFAPEILREIGGLFLVLWLPLRLTDWLIGGPRRRAARQRIPLSRGA